jgi:hypothetical protein
MSKFIQSQLESSKQLDVQNLSWCCATVFDLWVVYRVESPLMSPRGRGVNR